MNESDSKSLNMLQSDQESKQESDQESKQESKQVSKQRKFIDLVELELPDMSDGELSESDQYVLPASHVKFCFSPTKADGTFCYCGYWEHTQSYQQRIE